MSLALLGLFGSASEVHNRALMGWVFPLEAESTPSQVAQGFDFTGEEVGILKELQVTPKWLMDSAVPRAILLQIQRSSATARNTSGRDQDVARPCRASPRLFGDADGPIRRTSRPVWFSYEPLSGEHARRSSSVSTTSFFVSAWRSGSHAKFRAFTPLGSRSSFTARGCCPASSFTRCHARKTWTGSPFLPTQCGHNPEEF